MRLHFALIPIHGGEMAQNELNHFLAARRVAAVDRQFVSDGARSAWAICVTYVDGGVTTPGTTDSSGKKGVDYRDVLPPAEFQVYSKLRDLRKQVAQRDGVPPYAVFTNEQLAEMVRRNVRTAAELAKIDGVGPARVEKYATAFLEVLNAPPSAAASPSAPT